MEDSHQEITGAILLAAPIDGLNRVLRDIYIYTIIVALPPSSSVSSLCQDSRGALCVPL